MPLGEEADAWRGERREGSKRSGAWQRAGDDRFMALPRRRKGQRESAEAAA